MEGTQDYELGGKGPSERESRCRSTFLLVVNSCTQVSESAVLCSILPQPFVQYKYIHVIKASTLVQIGVLRVRWRRTVFEKVS